MYFPGLNYKWKIDVPVRENKLSISVKHHINYLSLLNRRKINIKPEINEKKWKRNFIKRD